MFTGTLRPGPTVSTSMWACIVKTMSTSHWFAWQVCGQHSWRHVALDWNIPWCGLLDWEISSLRVSTLPLVGALWEALMYDFFQDHGYHKYISETNKTNKNPETWYQFPQKRDTFPTKPVSHAHAYHHSLLPSGHGGVHFLRNIRAFHISSWILLPSCMFCFPFI